MSVPHTPQAATLMSTSRSPTSGTGTSSTRTTPVSRNTPARIVFGIGPSVCKASTTVLAPLIVPPPLQNGLTWQFPPALERTSPENLPERPRPGGSVSRIAKETEASADFLPIQGQPC